jgi:hypothetical protein
MSTGKEFIFIQIKPHISETFYLGATALVGQDLLIIEDL